MMEDDSRLTRAQSERLNARRKARNWALFIVLLALVVLFYFVSIVKMSHHRAPAGAGNLPVSAPAE